MIGRVAGGKALPPEVRRADCGQDRWGAAVCRRTHQDGAGVGPAAGVRGSLRADGARSHPWRFLPRCTILSWRGWIAWPSVKAVAQLGATIGRTFAYELLQAVPPPDDATLQHALRQLVEAELVYQRGAPPQATYTFKHALIQDAAYQSLLRSTRQQYHQRIAQRPGGTVSREHRDPAGAAGPSLYRGRPAPSLRCATGSEPANAPCGAQPHAEAIEHVTQALALLETLPEVAERKPASTRAASSPWGRRSPSSRAG